MHIVHSFSVMKVAPPVHVIFRSISKVGYFLGATGMFRIAADIFGCILLVVLARAVLKWRKEPQRNRRGEVHFLLMFSVLLIACYCLYIFGLFFFIRYYYPIYFVACIYAAFLLQDLFDWLPGRSPLLRKAVAVGGIVYALAFAYFSFSQAFRSRPVYHFYDLAQWANSHTEADETIGAFQGGAIGYLSHRRVVNLDGKVNREALEALKEGCLGDYLKREGIDLVIDHEKVIECFLRIHGSASNASCTPILRSSLAGSSSWIAFRPKFSKRAQAKPSGGGHEFPTSAGPQSSAQ
jgi:hypothetical protein